MYCTLDTNAGFARSAHCMIPIPRNDHFTMALALAGRPAPTRHQESPPRQIGSISLSSKQVDALHQPLSMLPRSPINQTPISWQQPPPGYICPLLKNDENPERRFRYRKKEQKTTHISNRFSRLLFPLYLQRLLLIHIRQSKWDADHQQAGAQHVDTLAAP